MTQYFLGFALTKSTSASMITLTGSRLDIGAKVVPKAYPEERVGLLATRDNQYTVLGTVDPFVKTNKP